MDNFFEKINNLAKQISIVEIISNYVDLKKKGSNYEGICPFHPDSSPSLIVNDQKRMYKCFSCNAGGGVFQFVQNKEKVNIYEAIKIVCKLANIENDFIKNISNFKENPNQILIDINQQTSKLFKNFLNNKNNSFALEYLNKRGITEILIKKFNIGFAPISQSIMIDLLTNKNNIIGDETFNFEIEDIKKDGLLNISNKFFFTNRLMFPISDINSNIVGFSGRSLDNDNIKYLNSKQSVIFDKSSLLYNLNNVWKENRNIKTLIIVEGFMDAISLTKIGISNVVATMGLAFTSKHLKILSKFPNLKNITICFDNDNAGQQNIIKTSELLKYRYSVYVVKYSGLEKDIDELINKDLDKAKITINNLIDLDEFLINKKFKELKEINDSEIELFINECLLFLSKTKQVLKLEKNLKLLSKLTKINYEVIENLLNKKSFNNNYLKNSETICVTDNNKEIINKCEESIIELILIDRKCLIQFQKKLNHLNNKNNQDLIQMIEEIYEENSLLTSITIKSLEQYFQDKNDLNYSRILEIIKSKTKTNEKNNSLSLNQTMETFLIRETKEKVKKIQSQIKDCILKKDNIGLEVLIKKLIKIGLVN